MQVIDTKLDFGLTVTHVAHRVVNIVGVDLTKCIFTHLFNLRPLGKQGSSAKRWHL